MKCGKVPDYFGLTLENIIYGGLVLRRTILNVLHAIQKIGEVPQCLKVGLIISVFETKMATARSIKLLGITV